VPDTILDRANGAAPDQATPRRSISPAGIALPAVGSASMRRDTTAGEQRPDLL
jgi:hypothetical protein